MTVLRAARAVSLAADRKNAYVRETGPPFDLEVGL
jgi:hypothetical protein